MGFERGLTNPCCFYHRGRQIRLVVHGDDFTALGCRADLLWYESKLAESFELKLRGHLGEAPGCIQEMRILNRIVRLTPEGLLYESDPRHAEMLVQALGEQTNSVATPGEKTIAIEQDATIGEDGNWESLRGKTVPLPARNPKP